MRDLRRGRQGWLLLMIPLLLASVSRRADAQQEPASRADSDSALVESRELIKNGEYAPAIDLLKVVVSRSRGQTERLREAYLLLVKSYVFAGNSYRLLPNGSEAALLHYKEARARAVECLSIPELRDTRLEPESEYPSEMLTSFADARAELFGAFRVLGLEPAGAMLKLDGEALRVEADRVFGMVELQVGRHVVTIEHADYRARVDTVLIRPGATLERRYRLERRHGALWYSSRTGLVASALAGMTLALRSPGAGPVSAPFELGSGRPLQAGPSLRAAGLGGASGAVWWGDDPDDWANPALLGLQRGIRYDWGRSRFVAGGGIARLGTRQLLLGGGGIGVALPGLPGDDGTARLEFPAVGAAIVPELSTGRVGFTEGTRTWGAGLDLPALIASVARFRGHGHPEWLREFDAALGLHRRRVLRTDAVGTGGPWDASWTDLGVLVRATVHDDDDETGSGSPVRIEASYGFARTHATERRPAPASDPLRATTVHQNAVALRLTTGRLATGAGRRTWFSAASFNPLLSLGASASFERLGEPFAGVNIRRYGLELTLGNVLALRAGNIQDRTAAIHAASFGVGIGYRYRDVIGFRYDWAAVPDAVGGYTARRDGLFVFLDPRWFGRQRP